MSCVESISKIIITLIHIGHFYEHINPLFSAYMKPHKTGFRNDNIKFVKLKLKKIYETYYFSTFDKSTVLNSKALFFASVLLLLILSFLLLDSARANPYFLIGSWYFIHPVITEIP